MIRQPALAIVLPLLFYPVVQVSSAAADELIAQGSADTHGLVRMWSMQMDIDRSRSRVQSAVLDRGVLIVQTDAAMVQAFDAETGRPVWSAPRVVGNPRKPTLAPAVNKNFVAVVNGSRVYVYNRYNGDLLWQSDIDGVPAAGPALVGQRVLVPTISGLIHAYRLKPVEKIETVKGKKAQAVSVLDTAPESVRLVQEHFTPLACQSSGSLAAAPMLLSSADEEDLVAWPTNSGALLIAGIPHSGSQFAVRRRFLAGTAAVGGLAYRPSEGKDPGLVYVVSREGLVHAVNERTGQTVWEFPVAEAVSEPPAVVGPNVYVAVQLGGMFCLDAKTGVQRWAAPLVTQFVAAGRDRIYAVDKLQRLVSLDPRTGSRLDSFDVHGSPFRLANVQTDRIYLVGQQGLIQCLRDTRQVEPLVYHLEQKPIDKKEKEKPAVVKKAAHAEHKPKPAADGMAVEEEEKPKKAAHKAREPKEPKEKKAKKGKKDDGFGANPNPFGAKPAAKE
jgi:outer membrane protein assembly factor BamB